jgi:hypothetical protein
VKKKSIGRSFALLFLASDSVRDTRVGQGNKLHMFLAIQGRKIKRGFN